MITSGFLFLIYGFVYAITSPLRLLTDVVLDGGFSTAIYNAGGYLSPVDMVIPIATLVTILGIFLLYEGFYLTYKITMWVMRRLPTQS